jgi:hypothetical protein
VYGFGRHQAFRSPHRVQRRGWWHRRVLWAVFAAGATVACSCTCLGIPAADFKALP